MSVHPMEPTKFEDWNQLRRLGKKRIKEIFSDEIVALTVPVVVSDSKKERGNPQTVAVVIPYTRYLRIQSVLIRLREFIDSNNWEDRL